MQIFAYGAGALLSADNDVEENRTIFLLCRFRPYTCYYIVSVEM